MKIAIVSWISRRLDYTGDCLQADKTAMALATAGCDVLRCYVDSRGYLYDKGGKQIGLWGGSLSNFDIVHAIPPIPHNYLSNLPRLKARLVASTIFWQSLNYFKVIRSTYGVFSLSILKGCIQAFLAWLRIPSVFAYRDYELLLPNSEDEILCCKRYLKTKRDVRYVAIPNAIEPFPEWYPNLNRPGCVPTEDYIVVPGYFAYRKNQLGLIRALRASSIPIVFLGDGPLLERCKKEADQNFLFLGYVPHGSQTFYGILKYARIVCLPSNCETPGIAALEGAACGARPVVPLEGGTIEYYGWDAEYLDPTSSVSIRQAIIIAWRRGRLTQEEQNRYRHLTWQVVASRTMAAYSQLQTIGSY